MPGQAEFIKYVTLSEASLKTHYSCSPFVLLLSLSKSFSCFAMGDIVYGCIPSLGEVGWAAFISLVNYSGCDQEIR